MNYLDGGACDELLWCDRLFVCYDVGLTCKLTSASRGSPTLRMLALVGLWSPDQAGQFVRTKLLQIPFIHYHWLHFNFLVGSPFHSLCSVTVLTDHRRRAILNQEIKSD